MERCQGQLLSDVVSIIFVPGVLQKKAFLAWSISQVVGFAKNLLRDIVRVLFGIVRI